jgi:hypothetical protein
MGRPMGPEAILAQELEKAKDVWDLFSSVVHWLQRTVGLSNIAIWQAKCYEGNRLIRYSPLNCPYHKGRIDVLAEDVVSSADGTAAWLCKADVLADLIPSEKALYLKGNDVIVMTYEYTHTFIAGRIVVAMFRRDCYPFTKEHIRTLQAAGPVITDRLSDMLHLNGEAEKNLDRLSDRFNDDSQWWMESKEPPF